VLGDHLKEQEAPLSHRRARHAIISEEIRYTFQRAAVALVTDERLRESSEKIMLGP